MCKRAVSLLLCLAYLLSLAVPVRAAEQEQSEETYVQYTVTNLDSFLILTKNCRLDSYSRKLKVKLMADLDLTGTGFSGIPIFSGILEGNGHTIRGLSITADGSSQGFFRYLTQSAVVQDLNLIGTVQPGGSASEIGSFAGHNEGMILNCTFTGSVSGSEYVGGIAGKNAVTGILENCRMNGSLYGDHFIGGLVGENGGVVRGCENAANVNDTAKENTVALSDITLNSLTSSEAVNTATDIGGIAGSSMGVIRECVNRGNVGYPHMGYNVGGIAGTQSGFILACENHGRIQGRKEVGGIVGQMEPTASIEYAEDALQILRRQLNSMAGVISDTMANVQGSGDAIVNQVANLQAQMFNARDAVDSLIPDRENPELPDLDAIQAAQNTIGSSISGMSESLKGMSATTYSALGQLSNNLYSLQGQINAMRTTLGNVSETLGGSLRDMSDEDTEENILGKVSQCTNYGSVQADRNAGGIAGAIAMENDLDPEEDWQVFGDNSLNFESELRSVVVGCSNTAAITCKKENCGGIVGWQSMGLVKDCLNSGVLDAASADYVGGISGQSTGFIRSSSAKSEISGSSYLGGIAGSATIVSDCRSLSKFHAHGERLGEVLGIAQEPARETETPISGNFYFSIEEDLGGIDGISYEGQAQGLKQKAFQSLENLPDLFTAVTLRFQYAGGQQRSFTVPLGGSFSAVWVPPIPPRDGARASWEGLVEEALETIYFDRTYEVQYTSKRTTLASDALRGKVPVMLVLGVFPEHAVLTMNQVSDPLPVEEGENLAEVWRFTVNDPEALSAVRFCLPEGLDGDHVRLMLQRMDGSWRDGSFEVDGSYLAVPMEPGDQGIAVIQTAETKWLPILISGMFMAAVFVFFLYRKRRKRS